MASARGCDKLDEYIRASKPGQVSSLLKKYRKKAMIIGGGVTIHELATRGLLGGVTTLIDISQLGLSYVKEDVSGIRIGASTTFSEFLNSRHIKARPAYGALVDALSAIRPVQVRNMATVGGALCSGIPLLDLPPTSVAMEAKVKLVGPGGRRAVETERFFRGFLQTALKPGEFMSELEIPRQPAHTGSAFQKLETNAVDWAILSVATKVSLDKERVAKARIVMGGGVGEVPVRATEAEKVLENSEPTAEVIRRAAERASATTEFTDDPRASADYRRAVARAFVKESLSLSLARAKED